jgi:uncharacterized protein (TIGR00251 family)
VTAGWVRDDAGGAVLELLVVPRAARTRVLGEHGGRLKLQLAAPPVDGAANEALLTFLAGALRLKRSAVVLLRGESARRKVVRVEGLGAEGVAAALAADAGPVPRGRA